MLRAAVRLRLAYPPAGEHTDSMRRILAGLIGVCMLIGIAPASAAPVPVWRAVKKDAKFGGRPASIWLNINSIDGAPDAATLTIQFRPAQVKTISRLNIGLLVDCTTFDATIQAEFAYDTKGKLIPGYSLTYAPTEAVMTTLCQWVNQVLPPPDAAEAESATAAPAASTSDEQLFANRVWQIEGNGAPGDPAPASTVASSIAMGHKICSDLDSGRSKSDVASIMAANGFRYPNLVVNEATLFLCPRYH